MELMLSFIGGVVCAVIINQFAAYREARRSDQLLQRQAGFNMEVIRRLLASNRTLENRLSAKDLQGYIVQEQIDQKHKQTDQTNSQKAQAGGRLAYPTSIIGNG